MDKSGPLARILVFTDIADTIQDMVADERACCIRNRCRNTSCIDSLDHCLDRQLGEIGIRSIRIDRLINRLIAFIIRNTAVIAVDADTLNRNIRPAASLSYRQNDIRITLRNLGINLFQGFVNNRWNLQLDNLGTGNLIRQTLDRFDGRVDWLAAKWIKSSYKNFHKIHLHMKL